MTRVFFSVWFSIQGIIQNTTNVLFSAWFRIPRITQNCPGYDSAMVQYLAYYLKISRVLFSDRSGFNVLLKDVQGIIQRIIKNV